MACSPHLLSRAEAGERWHAPCMAPGRYFETGGQQTSVLLDADEDGATPRPRTLPEPCVAQSEVARVAEALLPTSDGAFRALAFQLPNGAVTLALVHGQLGGEAPPLVRLHSECLTGDALGSLRCDCGEQLRTALACIVAAGEGVLLYLPQEGRGIGLANKIRAYALQDAGLDTVEANAALGLPVDAREYRTAAAVLRSLGVHRLRLLTNNPAKHAALQAEGLDVVERVSLEIPPNHVNHAYLETKASRMGHLLSLLGSAPGVGRGPLVDEANGAGPVLSRGPLRRPRVTVHYAQTLDGRIATRTGNSQWISGDESLVLAHQLRADHQAVMVGVGTVLADNPRLTVRHAAGPSPRRIVVDSTLRTPDDAHVLVDGAAPTLVATTRRASAERVCALQRQGVDVLVLPEDELGQVDLHCLLDSLVARRITSLLVEGGARLVTTALREHVVDRLVVCIAPKVLGAGIEAVGNLDVLRLDDAMTFSSSQFSTLGPDLIFDGQLAVARAHAA